MSIVLNGTTGITTPDIDSTAGFDAADITGTVGTAQITDANVTTAKIADANVTTAKIADANVTQGKLADQSVNEAKMQVSNAPVNGYVLSAQSGNTGGMTWAEAASGHWANLAEVTLGGSQVSAIDITLPTGYDVLKLDIRFPVCVGSTNRSVRMQLLDSNGAARSFGYQTDLFVTNDTPSQQQSRYGSTLTLSPPYGENSGDYCFYRLQFFDVDSSTIHTKWQGQGSAYINANAKAGNMLSSGMQYNTAHVTSTARFSLSGSTSFNTDDGCYYRLYGHSYS